MTDAQLRLALHSAITRIRTDAAFARQVPKTEAFVDAVMFVIEQQKKSKGEDYVPNNFMPWEKPTE